MLCVTHGLDIIASPWAYKYPQAILTVDRLLDITTVRAIADISAAQRKEPAEAAVEQLDLLTTRMGSGFSIMVGGNDQKKPWKVKAYVNVAKCPLRIRVFGPLGSVDEQKHVDATLAPGEALVTCAVHIEGEEPGKLTLPQGVKTQPQMALKALVLLGLCYYNARQMQAAAPGPIVAIRRALRSENSSPKDKRLNAAFVDLDDEAFIRVKAILGLRGEEEETVMAMSTNTRRRLREIFHLLASSDSNLLELAQSAVAEEDEEEEINEADISPRPATVLPSFAASEKCVCGIYEGGKMVHFEAMKEGEKVLSGRKQPI